eukprot:TRINITY_DN885_c0_g1_i2.p1 TRINITY_DN885_c0_g1~~TRINITY_DN885_c0_g1_i2.p1  ORF type:complete len:543 (-),score=177.72 TRINITY_DN885_c0_g1_i2:47-1675(-)
MAGLTFINPFGLASATPTTSADMIRRAFEQGWGFAVTKTFGLDKDLMTNVSPRIVRGTTSGHKFGPNQGSFLNIEIISEKTVAYWCKAIQELKRDFPKQHVIASIMAAAIQADWEELCAAVVAAGAVAIECNLSCPHGTGDKSMGLACGQDADTVEQITRWVRAATPAHIPVFIKVTPNVTDTRSIARAAKRGGATGVTAVNTISGLMGVDALAQPWPAVGNAKGSTYGGMSGNATRPVALKAISAIAKDMGPDFPIMGTGGADNADTVLQMIVCGASIVQICSAIQNQDYSIIYDLITGLKALLYMRARTDLQKQGWVGQSPPSGSIGRQIASALMNGVKLQDVVGRPSKGAGGKRYTGLPKFGEYAASRQMLRQREIEEATKAREEEQKPNAAAEVTLREGAGIMNKDPETKEQKQEEIKIESVHEVKGKVLSRLSQWMQLKPNEQVVALVDEELCINCGKCYMTCNDSGYQAIDFDAKTHFPTIKSNCTGCTLCVSVCPIPDCIVMVPRDMVNNPYVPDRGVTPADGNIRNAAAGYKYF